MDRKELIKEIDKLAKRANTRLKRLEDNVATYVTPYRMAQHATDDPNRVRFDRTHKGISNEDLEIRKAEIERFLNDPTSTISGAMKALQESSSQFSNEQIEQLNLRKQITENRTEYLKRQKTFWQVVNSPEFSDFQDKNNYSSGEAMAIITAEFNMNTQDSGMKLINSISNRMDEISDSVNPFDILDQSMYMDINLTDYREFKKDIPTVNEMLLAISRG